MNTANVWWAICRAGYPTVADEAERSWAQGKTYQIPEHVHLEPLLAREVKSLNWGCTHSRKQVVTS